MTFKIYDNSKIGSGTNAEIFRISPRRVIKVPKLQFCNEILQNEFGIQSQISKAGYPVPKPYGIFPVQISGRGTQNGLFMDFAPGVEARYSPNVLNIMERATEIVNQIEESEGIRISPLYGLYPRNVLYDERSDHITLVDFEEWETPDFQRR